LQQIMETKLSPEAIAALLNVMERRYSSMRSILHGNAKRAYPFWKTCRACSKPFPCHTKEQAVRNKTCSKVCANGLVGQKAKGRPSPFNRRVTIACAVCGKTKAIPQAWRRRVETPVCSRQCNGVLRGEAWKAHAHKGRAAWRPESEAALVERFTGPSNPSWKGGVTYRRRRGNYVSVRYVRCPPEFLPMARNDGYVMEHRLVVARILGRCLTRIEAVHHIDHKPLNNHPANLMLFATNKDHKLFEGGAAIVPLWDGSRPSTTTVLSGASEFALAPS
jgi:hypothetical protein